MLRVGSIVSRVADPKRQEAFCGSALDYERRHARDDFVILRPRTGDGLKPASNASTAPALNAAIC